MIRRANRTLLLLAILGVLIFSIPAFAEYSGGAGTYSNPWQIATVDDLLDLAANTSHYRDYFILTAKIDLAGLSFIKALIAPDRSSDSGFQGTAFRGFFDGNGYIIKNLTINTKRQYLGLFGQIEGGTVINLGVRHINITGSSYIGGLCGSNKNGTISGCHTKGNLEGFDYNVGGLAGFNDGTVSQCYSTASVDGDDKIGGLVAKNDGTIVNCYSTGPVSGDDYVGGLAGSNSGDISQCYSTGSVDGDFGIGGLVGCNGGDLSQCYSTSSVSGDDYVGGLVGANGGDLSQCYSTGSVSGDDDVGGLAGKNSGDISQCYSTGSVSGDNNIGGLVADGTFGSTVQSFWDIETSGLLESDEGFGRTTTEMQNMSTYSFNGWKESVWTIDNGNDYPHLEWENKTGQYIAGPVVDMAGSGTAEDPWLIETVEDLQLICSGSFFWDKHLILMSDLNLDGLYVYQIAYDFTNSFNGSFDGNGHVIRNMNILSSSTYASLFGYLGENGEIKNLGLENVFIDADASASALVGVNCGIVTRCYSTGSIAGTYYAGGLVANNYGMVNQCFSTCSVSNSRQYIGGIVGRNHGTITQCYSSGTISGGSRAGGLAGFNDETISQCYSTGSVSGSGYVGGLLGENDRGGVLDQCYSTGSVNGSYYIGGLIGYSLFGGSGAKSSFWDTETSGMTKSEGGFGLATADMQSMTTYSFNGWEGDVWTIDNGNDYPRLAWENKTGQYIAEPVVEMAGSGSAGDPWQIETIEDFRLIGIGAFFWDKYLILMSDLDLSGVHIYRIRDYRGVFDGNGHVISNLNINLPDSSYVGLINYLGESGKIKNLGLEDVLINGEDCVGALVGINLGTINRCYSSGSINGNDRIGGVVGYNYQGIVDQCYSSGSVSGNDLVGGVVGSNPQDGIIDQCYNESLVNGNERTGGVAGHNSGTVTNCYSTGSVSGVEYIGGLCGSNYGGTIARCYSTGLVDGTDSVGGLTGYEKASSIDTTASFWNIETSNQLLSASGEGKTTTQMKDVLTYYLWFACTNEGNIWTIDDGNDYPRLTWENKPGEVMNYEMTDFMDGTGEPNTPYLIETAKQLNIINMYSCHLDKHFELIADIDMSDRNEAQFNIIGSEEVPFTGSFDGNGHDISNFTYISHGQDNIGLFGYIEGANSLIENLTLVDPNVDGGNAVSAICGALSGGTIVNCYIEYGNVAGENKVGGLVGCNDQGFIVNCLSSADITGNDNIGGLVGKNNGSISTSYSTCSVTGSRRIGGLLGNNSEAGTITDCYSISDMNGLGHVGGLIGSNYGSISNSYAASNVPTIKTSPKIYWVGAGYGYYDASIFSSDIENGNEEILVDYIDSPSAITLDPIEEKMYWADGRFGGIQRANLDGSEIENVITNISSYLRGITLDLQNGKIYWAAYSTRKIQRANLDGSDIEDFINTGDYYPDEIVLDIAAEKIYWLETRTYGIRSRIMCANFDGSNVEMILESALSIYEIAVDTSGGKIYWTQEGSNSYKIVRANIDGSDVEELIDGGVWYSDIELDISAGKMYLTVYYAKKIQRADLDGSNIEDVLSQTSRRPFSLAFLPELPVSGGLVGSDRAGSYSNNFWDLEASFSTDVNGIGNKPAEPNVVGLNTEQMQMESTFTEAGWDFVTPIWTICEGFEYPRLWWEPAELVEAPVLHSEPEMTLNTSNSISWDTVPDANEYYVQCAQDSSFANIVADSGWVTGTSFEFTGLALGQTYWYRVIAATACAESDWSNVESSMQVTPADAVDIILDPDSMKNANMKNALMNKLDEVQVMIDDGLYKDALAKLEHDILKKTDGCANNGEPDKNDWIKTCREQGEIYPLIIETIDYVRSLCVVDIGNLAGFANQWLGSGSGLEADLDNNGRVDLKDFSILVNR